MPNILYILSIAGGTGDIAFGLKLLIGLYLRYCSSSSSIRPSATNNTKDELTTTSAVQLRNPPLTNEDGSPFVTTTRTTVSSSFSFLPNGSTIDIVLCQQAGGNPWISLRKFIEGCHSLGIQPSFLCCSIRLWIRTNNGSVSIRRSNSSLSNGIHVGRTDGSEEDASIEASLYQQYKDLPILLNCNIVTNETVPDIILQGPLKVFDTSDEILSLLCEHSSSSDTVLTKKNLNEVVIRPPPLLTIREMGQGRFCSTVATNNRNNNNNGLFTNDVSSGIGMDEIGIFNEAELYSQLRRNISNDTTTGSDSRASSTLSSVSTVWMNTISEFSTYLERIAGTRLGTYTIDNGKVANEIIDYSPPPHYYQDIPKYFVGYYRTPKHGIQYSRFILSYLLLSIKEEDIIQNKEERCLPIMLPMETPTMTMTTTLLPSSANSSWNTDTYVHYFLQGLRNTSFVQDVDCVDISSSSSSSSSSSRHPIAYIRFLLRIHNQLLPIRLLLYDIMVQKLSLYSFYTLLSYSSGNIVTGDATLSETLSRSVSIHPVPYYYSTENHKVFIDQDTKRYLQSSPGTIDPKKYNDGSIAKDNEKISQLCGEIIIHFWKYIENRKQVGNTEISKGVNHDSSWTEFVTRLMKGAVTFEKKWIRTEARGDALIVPVIPWNILIEAFRVTFASLVRDKGTLIDYVGNWIDARMVEKNEV